MCIQPTGARCGVSMMHKERNGKQSESKVLVTEQKPDIEESKPRFVDKTNFEIAMPLM